MVSLSIEIKNSTDRKIPGLHFNPDGYKLLFDATMETIKQRWPDQDSDSLPFESPTWQVALQS